MPATDFPRHPANARTYERHRATEGFALNDVELEASRFDRTFRAARDVTVARDEAPEGLNTALPRERRRAIGRDVLEEVEATARSQHAEDLGERLFHRRHRAEHQCRHHHVEGFIRHRKLL